MATNQVDIYQMIYHQSENGSIVHGKAKWWDFMFLLLTKIYDYFMYWIGKLGGKNESAEKEVEENAIVHSEVKCSTMWHFLMRRIIPCFNLHH
jgi:hypothetical protein